MRKVEEQWIRGIAPWRRSAKVRLVVFTVSVRVLDIEIAQHDKSRSETGDTHERRPGCHRGTSAQA
jgi:hypothetical protein